MEFHGRYLYAQAESPPFRRDFCWREYWRIDRTHRHQLAGHKNWVSKLVANIGSTITSRRLLRFFDCVAGFDYGTRQRTPKKLTAAQPAIIGGSAWAGAKQVLTQPYFAAIALALACANFLGGATYIYMAEMVSITFDGTDRQTQVFAIMDAMINALSFIGQLLLVKHSVRRIGLGRTLALLPLVSVIGFTLLALNPAFVIIAGLQVLRRSIGFGFTKPTTDMLYSVVSKESKYKAKNFIETTVYRAWDVLTSWTVRSMSGIGLSGIALVCVPIALLWSVVAIWIGREYKRRDQETSSNA